MAEQLLYNVEICSRVYFAVRLGSGWRQEQERSGEVGISDGRRECWESQLELGSMKKMIVWNLNALETFQNL